MDEWTQRHIMIRRPMGVNHPQFGTFCTICYEQLTKDTCAVDTDGVKWDVCPGQCATEAGIKEQQNKDNT